MADPQKYESICLPALRRVARPEDLLIEAEHERSTSAAYDEVLDALRERDDLEALVLLREDTELTDPHFHELLGRHLADRDVAIVGDDGPVMALSPWAVRNLRFDDGDVCAQARAAGKRVVVTGLPVAPRHPTAETGNAGGAGVRETSAADDGYFERARPELRALVPATARRVLDVGCGGGGVGAALKADLGCEVVGIEGFPDAAARARGRLDRVLCLDLDSLDALPPDLGRFDAVVFGDVLEHLRDPARLMRTLLPALDDDGVMVCSIPNVRHWTVVHPLLVEDRWTYQDAGLLDRTHVHFFTLREAVDMLAEIGLEVVDHDVIKHLPLASADEPLAAVAAALGGDSAETAAALGAYQYLLVVRRAAAGAPPRAARTPPVPAPRLATAADARALVPASAERVLDVELDALPTRGESYDALVLRGVLEHVRDPAALLRTLLPSLDDDGVLVLAVPNVKHWSVLAPLLAHDRWVNGPLRYFTLEEISDLLDEVGLEGVQVVPNESAPAPPELSVLSDLASAAGAEREETHLRLGACEYLVVARRPPLN